MKQCQSCGARQPLRANVSFFHDVASAEKAGFRSCKRCQPNEQKFWNKNQELVTTACRYIESAETSPMLKQLAAKMGLSEYHFHRIFKEATGVTPKAYANSVRAKNVKDSLRTTATVTEAIYDAGYGASSRFYEKSQSFLGMTPQQFAKYGLLRLGIGQDLERIVKGGGPRRIAPTEEILALKPELAPPR